MVERTISFFEKLISRTNPKDITAAASYHLPFFT
jgi:hypothetical protein